MFYVKYLSSFSKTYPGKYNYALYSSKELAYWHFTHTPNALSFGSIDDSFVFLLNIIEEVSDVKQKEDVE